MNKRKLEGHKLEYDLYETLKSNKNNFIVKCESEIKSEYYNFCGGVDIMCTYNDNTIFIQCKWSNTKANVEQVNHFILLSRLVQSKIKSKNYKLLWVSKIDPSSIGLDSLHHFDANIISNDDIDNLIHMVEKYIFQYFNIYNN
jgi:hypothetical protein